MNHIVRHGKRLEETKKRVRGCRKAETQRRNRVLRETHEAAKNKLYDQGLFSWVVMLHVITVTYKLIESLQLV